MSEAQNYVLAEQDYMSGMKYKDIAEKYGVTLNTVKSWKVRYGWNKKGVHTKSEKVCTQKRKHGGQPGNKNAVGHGAPPRNKNAEKFGFFSKYLPEETVSIIQEMPTDPLDILWDQIQIAYATIIRAQRIAYVRDRDDKTKEKIMSGETSDMYSVQQAWDKQNEFMKAQARAQSELRSLIKQYDEMLHKDWGMASDEQRARIAQIKAQTERLSTQPVENEDDGVEIINDADEKTS